MATGEPEPEALPTVQPEPPPPPQPRLLLYLTFVSCLLFTGPVFGFGALQTVMQRDGEYAHLCDVAEDAAALAERAGGRACPAQENALALIYAVGGTVPFWSAPTGMVLDLLGPVRSSAASTTLQSPPDHNSISSDSSDRLLVLPGRRAAGHQRRDGVRAVQRG